VDLIDAVCFLRQYQKVIKRSVGMDYIEYDLEDYCVAHRIIVLGVLSSTMFELPPRGAGARSAWSRAYWRAFQQMKSDQSKQKRVSAHFRPLIHVSASRSEVSSEIGIGDLRRGARRYLVWLGNQGFRA